MGNNNNAFAFGEFFKNDFDQSQLLTSQQRNMEVFTAAGQAVAESAQAISRRQAEITRDNVEQAMQASKELFTGGTPETNLSKQADFTRDMFENSLAGLREVVEMATKSSFEAFEAMSKHAAQSAEEFSHTPAATKSKATKK